eukprot:TRINITY_DN10087_c0_g1_i1.p1 TRINITY_DN10087_c0_g1~~TRINITY_DN10087_c0_g1_i1.p1  ORF type:complete len:756 (+),score=146.98 TRINITY_DN10087_c0_g1_i1:303-2270(+)
MSQAAQYLARLADSRPSLAMVSVDPDWMFDKPARGAGGPRRRPAGQGGAQAPPPNRPRYVRRSDRRMPVPVDKSGWKPPQFEMEERKESWRPPSVATRKNQRGSQRSQRRQPRQETGPDEDFYNSGYGREPPQLPERSRQPSAAGLDDFDDYEADDLPFEQQHRQLAERESADLEASDSFEQQLRDEPAPRSEIQRGGDQLSRQVDDDYSPDAAVQDEEPKEWRAPRFVAPKNAPPEVVAALRAKFEASQTVAAGPMAVEGDEASAPPSDSSTAVVMPDLDDAEKEADVNSVAWQKVNLYELKKSQLRYYFMKELGLKRGRVETTWEAMYKWGQTSFEDIGRFPHQLRRDLARVASIGSEEWTVLADLTAKDGTVKRAYGIPGGHVIESVLMPYEDGRHTACISTQVGCAQGCVFCATGQMGFKRQLTATEIFEQAARYSALLRRQGKRLSNVVLLGMGEPLANYKNVMDAIQAIHSRLGISMRRITLSTVGLAPKIRELADAGVPVTLAISLHAATDAERSALLPANNNWNIAEVLDAARYFREKTGRRVSFEWTLIHGNNDDVPTASRLGQLLQADAPGSHVNVIPLNPTKGYVGGPSDKTRVQSFIDELAKWGITATSRVRRGIDIDAGCGQLATREEYKAKQAAQEQLANA